MGKDIKQQATKLTASSRPHTPGIFQLRHKMPVRDGRRRCWISERYQGRLGDLEPHPSEHYFQTRYVDLREVACAFESLQFAHLFLVYLDELVGVDFAYVAAEHGGDGFVVGGCEAGRLVAELFDGVRPRACAGGGVSATTAAAAATAIAPITATATTAAAAVHPP